MSGLVAILGPVARAEREACLDQMLRTAGGGAGRISVSWSGAECAMRLLPGRSAGPTTGIHEDAHGVLAVLGDLWPVADGPVSDLLPATLLAGFARDGAEFRHGLDGCFAAVLWDKRAGRAFLFGDAVGVGRLFLSAVGEQVLVASQVFALAAHPAGPRELDPLAAGEFLTFGLVSGRRTALRGAEAVVPGTVVELRRGERPRRLMPAPPPPAPPLAGSAAELGAELARLVTAVVRSQTGAGDRMTITLDGGPDARLLLAAAIAAGRPVRAWTLGLPGTRATALAGRAARALGVTLDCVAPCADHVLDHAGAALRHTDGLYSLFHCQARGALPGIVADVDLLLDGVTALDACFGPADLRRGAAPADAGDPRRVAREFLPVPLPGGRVLGSLFPRGNDQPLNAALVPTLRAHLLEVVTDFLAEGGKDETDLWAMLERFQATRLLPGFLARGARLGEGLVRVRAPLLDQRVRAFARQLPLPLRTNARQLAEHALRALAPAAAAVPLAHTLRPAAPGVVGGLWSRALGWTRSLGSGVLLRAGLRPPVREGAAGTYDRWTRETGRLRQCVEDLLLRRDAWHHCLLDPEYSRFLIETHLRGQWHGSELIGRLLTLEHLPGLLPARPLVRQ